MRWIISENRNSYNFYIYKLVFFLIVCQIRVLRVFKAIIAFSWNLVEIFKLTEYITEFENSRNTSANKRQKCSLYLTGFLYGGV